MKLLPSEFWNKLRSDSVLICWIFLRGLAFIYFFAFLSMAVQVEGLLGENGILPVTENLFLIENNYPESKIWHFPTIFWINSSDTMLKAVCYAGMIFSGFVLLNIFTRIALLGCYVLYLSIVVVGQDFTLFQWDTFLLEIGFLSLFIGLDRGISVLLFRWLLARFMFMGGVVKLASGDINWANLTALNFHYETQPLPTPIAYYAHQLPEWFHKACVGGVFFIELIVPFFVFLPRRFRLFACFSFFLLQSVIIFTGNYNFFNLLVIVLCLFLLEDKDIARVLPNRLIVSIQNNQSVTKFFASVVTGLWGCWVIIMCVSQVWIYHVGMPSAEILRSLLKTTSTFSLVNNYGPFAVMTTVRNEIIIQGSDDDQHWSDYEFKYKPGALDRELTWNIPHQPRLDWQMWFAALDGQYSGYWFKRFLIKLKQGSTPVLSLLGKNPFPDKPPRYLRAVLYRYNYTTSNQRKKNGNIWHRRFEGVYRLVN